MTQTTNTMPTDESTWSEEAAIRALGPNPIIRDGVNHTATITRPCGHTGVVLLYWPDYPPTRKAEYPFLNEDRPCLPEWMPRLIAAARHELRRGDFGLKGVYCAGCAVAEIKEA
jgi:hypothetical protein